MATVNPGYLIPHIRLTLGDINSTAYRYTNEWVLVALEGAIKTLAKWWNAKYLLDSTLLLYRNPAVSYLFLDEEPPVIQVDDERAIVLMTCIILLEGSLENNAWNLSSWKDNELSFTNLEQGRSRDNNLARLERQLYDILQPPTKKLARALKGSLPGYLNNEFERTGEY
jgi:hypothetical protein